MSTPKEQLPSEWVFRFTVGRPWMVTSETRFRFDRLAVPPFVLGIVAACAYLAATGKSPGYAPLFVLWTVIVATVLLYMLVWVPSRRYPLRLRVSQSGIVIEFAWRKWRIPLASIAAVDLLDRQQFPVPQQGLGFPPLWQGFQWSFRHKDLGKVVGLGVPMEGAQRILIRRSDAEALVLFLEDPTNCYAACRWVIAHGRAAGLTRLEG